MKLHKILNPIFCLSFLLSAGSLTVWANEEDDQLAAEQKSEEEEKTAKEREKEEEYKAKIPYSFSDVSENLVIIECTTSMGKMVGSGFIAEMDGKIYI
nr:hypothetical protein [Spirochaetales bacterium]